MNGRDILNKITYSDSFYLNALAFEDAIRNGKCLVLDTPKVALEFLTLYCVSLMTKEADYSGYDLDRLLQTYNRVKSTLKSKNKIANTDFLSNPPEKFYFVLRDNTCFKLYEAKTEL